jgi:uncharacterized protein (TIGR04255 family)
MTNHSATFADYEDPPVCEVVLCVQFEPLTKLRTPHIGFLWNVFQEKRGLRKIEEHPPLPPAMELFGPQTFEPQIQITDFLPVPRCWFLNDDETELVQVQQDRFAHNWRRKDTRARYPRYPTIRKAFLSDLSVFESFLEERDLGELIPNLCEVTYVNPIPLESDWDSWGKLHKVLTVVSSKYSDSFLPEPEAINLGYAFVIRDKEGKPVGRLRVSIQPGSTGEGQAVFFLRLTARLFPEGSGTKGVMESIDRGREWIVKGFGSITTKRMHKHWGKKDDT